ncbi:MAG: ABC transporter ATP-binding protein [Bacteroidales bacterium]|nr:ABC transporter ATP-binding protein [Bacteroidales bacterium]
MIEVKSISKTYGKIVSLRDISFNIQKGEIFGLLGPNGAGKSTTVNILNTLLKPDSGEIYIDGANLLKDPGLSKTKMGVVPQEIALYDNLTAFENLIFWGGLYKVPGAILKKNAIEILELVGLSGRKNDRIKTFSGGMKRRINIACSLLHKPEILILDEPTAGVDPQNRNHIFEVIENLNSEGMTIIYTTHYMEEAERLCDTIGVIDLGTIRAYGTLSELREISGAMDIITIRSSGTTEKDFERIKNTIPYNIVDNSNNSLRIECDNISEDISGIIENLKAAGLDIKGVEAQGANLESIYLRLTGKKLRD